MTKTNAIFQTTLIRIPRFGIARVLTYLAAVCFGFRASDFGFTRVFISDLDIRISDLFRWRVDALKHLA